MDHRPEVMVVGAGIAGVSLALALHHRGISVLLIEREATPRERFKGEYLQPIAVERLRRLGLGDLIDAAIESGEATSIRELRFRDLEDRGLLSWIFPQMRLPEVPWAARGLRRAKSETFVDVRTDLLMSYPSGMAGLSISQATLSQKLRVRARQVLAERFIEGVELRSLSKNLDRPRFRLRSVSDDRRWPEVLAPRLVVGADGRHSTVRSWMQGPRAPALGTPVWGADPEMIVGFDFQGDPQVSHRYEVIRTPGDGTFSLFKIRDQVQRLYWNTLDRTSGKQGWARDACEQLEKNVKPVLGIEGSVGQVFGAPADAAWFGPAAKGRFVLIGDALAVTTPLGGQGMAFALEHVERLAQAIPPVFRRRSGKARSPSVVDSARLAELRRVHHRASRRYFHHIALMNQFLYHLCFNRSGLARRLSRRVFAHWNAHPEVRNLVAEYFGGLRVEGLNPVRIAELLGLPGFMARFQKTGFAQETSHS
ncbi:MAG: hypothetical protein RJB38_1094 [Pseudomonadota bacterium]|jgi:2-polyprenyl-6-methoxyphenol hydroxylase-like FAD-dependent oxidoreductase